MRAPSGKLFLVQKAALVRLRPVRIQFRTEERMGLGGILA